MGDSICLLGGADGPQRQEDYATDDSLRPLRPHGGQQGRAGGGRHRELGDPGVVRAAKADSHAHALIKENKAFALSILGKGQQALAFTFFKPAELKGETISGEKFHRGATGSPILANAPAFLECTLEAAVEKGDHSVFVGKVVEAGVTKTPDGRADDATLWLKELGDKVFYGG